MTHAHNSTASAKSGNLDDLTRDVLALRQQAKALRGGHGPDAANSARALEGALLTLRSSLGLTAASQPDQADTLKLLQTEVESIDSDSLEDRNRLVRPTGIALVDNGPLCEQGDARGDCYLSHEQRNHLLLVLSTVTGTAFANFRDAIQDARIDEMVATDDGMGLLGNLLFSAAMGVFANVAVGALNGMRQQMRTGQLPAAAETVMLDLPPTKLEQLVAHVSDEKVGAIVGMTTEKIKTKIDNAIKEPTDHRGKAAFLQIVREGLKSAEDSFITDVPAKSDDAQLVGLVLDYRDAVAHSVAAYRAQVDIITARFSHQKIASAGKSTGDARLVLAKLICGDRSRHAMLRQRDDGRYFENFVDESFVPTALATQRANKADTGIGVNIGTSAATVPDDILEIHVDDRNRGGLKLLDGGFLLPNENLDTWIKGNTGEADSDETQT